MARLLGICLFILLVVSLIYLSKYEKNILVINKNCSQLSLNDTKKISSDNFSKFEAILEISDWRKWQLINIKDRVNFEKYNQFTNRQRVEGKLTIKSVNNLEVDCFVNVLLRPHGDQKDHRDGNYLPSLQVKIKDTNLFGITDFLLLRPSQRGYFNEILVSAIFRDLNILAPRSSMVKINFNNQDYNFVFQEKIRKEFLENSGYKEGPIIEGDERFVFDKGDVPFVNHRISNKNFSKRNISNTHISEIALSKLNFYGSLYYNTVHRNWLVDYYSISEKRGLNDFHNLDIFDAMMFATDSLAGLSVQDRRFYYNSIDQLFYPIFYDGIPRVLDKNNNLVKNEIKFDNLTRIKKPDIEFFLPSMFEGKITQSAKNGSQKAKKLLSKINKIDFNKKLNNLGLSLNLLELNQIFDELDSRLNEISKFGENKIFHLEEENKDFFINKFRNPRFTNQKLVFYDENEKLYKLCRVNYSDCESINKDILNKANLLAQSTKYVNEDLIFIGKKINKKLDVGWYFQENINKFSKLKLKDLEILYSNGIVFSFDEKSKVVSIKKNKPFARVLIQNQRLENWTVNFTDLTNINDQVYNKSIFTDLNGLTGCLSLYNTVLDDVSINIENSKCEDGLNIIKSYGHIKHIKISDSISDALDFDFSDVSIDKIDIQNASNDCTDFSYGTYYIKYLHVVNCADKGLSVGENSIVNLEKFNSEAVNIGVASKDSSTVEINYSTIDKAKNCYSLYRKKKEFFISSMKINSSKCKNFVKVLDADKNAEFIINGEKISAEMPNPSFDKESIKIDISNEDQIIDLIRDFPSLNDDQSANAVIEISKGMKEKWQVSKKNGYLEHEFEYGSPRKVSMSYPFNYGIIPQTIMPLNKGGDGDPLDIVILGDAIDQASVMNVRIIGTLKMYDYGEIDDKVIAIKQDDENFLKITNLNDLKNYNQELFNNLVFWFENYKGKNVTKIISSLDNDQTLKLIKTAHKDFKKKGISHR